MADPSAWISCKERLPPDSSDNVLALVSGRFAVQAFYSHPRKRWLVYGLLRGDYAECERDVTHWMLFTTAIPERTK